MGDIQRELLSVLLDRVLSLGLISDALCSRAKERLYTAADIPSLEFLDKGGGKR